MAMSRGLSYGSGSVLTARRTVGAFYADAQTRNDAAPQVADLIKATMASLAASPPAPDELAARKSSLVGEYGRGIATAAGLGEALENLAVYGIDLREIRAYPDRIAAVTADQAQAFARDELSPQGASVIVAGDGKQFIDALKAKAPDLEVVPIAQFAPDNPTLKPVAP